LFNRNSLCGVGVGAATTAEALDEVHEPTVVLDPALGASGLLLLLLLLLHLGRLTLDLSGTSQRTVNLTSQHGNVEVQLEGAESSHGRIVGHGGALAVEAEVLGVDAMDLGQLVLEGANRDQK